MVENALQFFRLAANACGTKTGVLPSLYDGLPCAADNAGNLTPGVNSIQDVGIIIANIMRILIAISGSLAVILILIASIYYITSTGDPARVKKAKEILIQTVIGLGVIILSYAVVTFIAGEF